MPALPAPSYLLALSLLLTLAAVLFWRGRLRRGLPSLAGAGLVFLSLSLGAAYVVADYLSGSGIDQSVLYHLAVGLEGAGLADFRGLIGLALAGLAGIVALSYAAFRIVQSKPGESGGSLRMLAGFCTLALALVVNPAARDLARLAEPPPTEAAPALFLDPQGVAFAGRRKNLVILYLESVERTYLDQSRFPGLMPNLAALEDRALSFSGITEVGGASWTIAAMTAGLCGVPLVAAGANNSMSGADQFLPGARCLGDILKKNGYAMQYLGGADLDFAGKGAFYETHGFDRVEGREELEPTLDDPGYTTDWGLYDDSLYALAADRFDALAASGRPFGLVLLTLDTHHPYGDVARACGDAVYGDGGNEILNAVHCADRMAADFIGHVLDSGAAADTLLVVASDHLAMRNTAWDLLEEGERRNLLMLFGAGIAPGRVDRPGSTLDIAPTVLGFLGAPVPGLGYGRDLTAPAPTLVEDVAQPDDLLWQDRGFLAALWDFPDPAAGLRVDADAARLHLGSRSVKLPAVFVLGQTLSVTELLFDFHSDEALPRQVAALGPGDRFLWVDRCARLAALGSGSVPASDGYCAAAGALGSAGLTVMALEEGRRVDFDDLRPAFGAVEIRAGLYEQRLADLARIGAAGAPDAAVASRDGAPGGRFALKSAGFGAGPSYVVNLATGQQAALFRGLTLVGLDPDRAPVKLAHRDTCGLDEAYRDTVGLERDFASVMDRFAGQFGAFAIIAHDSAACDSYDFAPLFEGTGLTRWPEIALRTPYVAVIAGDGTVSEYTGPAETALAVEVADVAAPAAGSP